MKRPDFRIPTLVLGLTLFLLPACAPAPAPDRTSFATPDEAAKALLNGLKTNNADELKAIFGPDVEKDLSSGDPVSDRHDREVMALAMGHSWRWAPAGDDQTGTGDRRRAVAVPRAPGEGPRRVAIRHRRGARTR